jgi:phosphonate transport system substrate-binding protein
MNSPRFRIICFFVAALVICSTPTNSVSGDDRAMFRLGITTSLFPDTNENDVRAAMKAWIITVARQGNIPLETDLKVFGNVIDLLAFGRKNRVDGYGVVLPEYPILRREMDFDVAILGVSQGRLEEEYLIVVHREGGADKLEALRGKSLRVLQSPRMSLATLWLDTLLLEAGLPTSAVFFGPTEWSPNISMTALPVFFGKTDACLVTRAGFEVMAELNPQLETRLRILANSPPVVPAGFMVRSDYRSPYRAKLLDTMARLEESTGGRQILSLIQMDRVEIHPVSRVAESLALIERHRQLAGPATAGDAAESK